MSMSVGNKPMQDRRGLNIAASKRLQQTETRSRRPTDGDLELLRKINTQLSRLHNQPGGQNKKLHFRSIPTLLTGPEYGYESCVYEAAARIFNNFAKKRNADNPAMQLIEYASPGGFSQTNSKPQEDEALQSERTKLQTYELAFRTLKYKDLFEQVLLESGHLRKYPVDSSSSALLMVMLVDFQSRDFSSRPDVIDDVAPSYLQDIEQSLHENKISLAAALARSRVKHQSRTIDYILPKQLRNLDSFAAHLPQYFWVNTMKTTVESVIEKLDEMGYEECTDNKNLLPMHGKYYRMDANCDDLLLVPRDQRDILETSDLVTNSEIVLQGKTSCLAVLTMESLFASNESIEVIHSDVSSGFTTAHLAISLYRTAKKRDEKRRQMMNRLNFTAEPKGTGQNRFWEYNTKGQNTWSTPVVYAFGIKSDEHRRQLEKMFADMNVKNIELVKQPFTDSHNFGDARFNSVKSILITPQGTRSAVVNPIDFMLKEGDTQCIELMQDLSSGTLRRRASVSGAAHVDTLLAAMHYKSVTSLVYETRSHFEEENENVLMSALEKQPGGLAQSRFKLSPPTISLTSNDVTGEQPGGKRLPVVLRGKFLKIDGNNEMNGCFIAVFVKSVEYILKVKEVRRKQSQVNSPSSDLSTQSSPAADDTVEDTAMDTSEKKASNKSSTRRQPLRQQGTNRSRKPKPAKKGSLKTKDLTDFLKDIPDEPDEPSFSGN